MDGETAAYPLAGVTHKLDDPLADFGVELPPGTRFFC